MNDWNPSLYMKFEDERTRPARDLLAQISLEDACAVVDLGCGPGNSSELLGRRFPEARLTGLDTSEAMLTHARRRLPLATFVKEDIADWAPKGALDVVFANAALQLLPDHERLFARLASFVRAGGCLAVQMPNSIREASHAAMRIAAAEGPWARTLVPIAKTRPVIASVNEYYEWLRPLSRRLEIWETTYVHALDGAQGIVDWFAGSALRPFLEPLDENGRKAFLARYREELVKDYKPQSDGRILLPYPRLFIVATR